MAATPPARFGPDSALFSSRDHTWQTPDWLYTMLHSHFNFTLDAAATPETAKAPAYYTPADDGLAQPWPGRVWLNPPYGRVIGQWIAKAYAEATQGAADLVVCLVPARTDTAYWHDYARLGVIWYLRGRLKFGSPDGAGRAPSSAPFPSAIVIFRAGQPPATAYWDPAEPMPTLQPH